ncbi:MAG: tRNA epoxyqueuosine(34) reductase QueG [Bacteroidales bacterium]|nr:MAG: tRNA epoxyqueuosine(34) reductase QueG [Bacteroidales bacterium]
MTTSREVSDKIKRHAMQLGFDACGISKADALEQDAFHLEQWLETGKHGEMKYMSAYPERRSDPRKLVEGAGSVISVIMNYYPEKIQSDPKVPRISKYAYGRDYHRVMKKKLLKLLEYIKENIGRVKGEVFVDSAPVLDRAWAAKAGLGWIGKNSNLISRKFGSFVFIGELVVDMILRYDHTVKDLCGDCTRCIEACPTGAIVTEKVIDARRCISYITIEHRGEIPSRMKGKMNNWIFGCDVCQDVCPWNRKRIPHGEPDFKPHPELLQMTGKEWFALDEKRFIDLFSGTPVMRAKYAGLKRNLEFL